MILFMDGFDHYVTGDLSKKWTSGGAGSINATGGRRGGGAFVATSNATGHITRSFASGASWVIGFAYLTPFTPATNVNRLVSLWDGANGAYQATLSLNLDGTLEVKNGVSTAVTGGKSTLTLAPNAWNYIEFKITIADAIAANSCKVRVNGVDWITAATGQDLKATVGVGANIVYIGQNGSNGVGGQLYDDLYICDQSGSTNNDFLGDVRIDTLYPNADGTYNQFTPSTGVSHFDLVDETAPNTTDYNTGVTIGDRDSYNMSNLTALASQTIYGVQVNAAVIKDDAGSKSIGTFVRSGTTDSDGASAALGTSQVYVSQVFETNPNGAIAWTEATVNAMEAGVRVTA